MPLSLGETAYRLFHTDGVHPYTILEVVDEGCGIPRQLLDKIFDPFFSTKGSRGTGLGMPVTRKIIEEHGGRLEVDSTPGEGTTVRFLLPHLDEKESNHKESEQCTGT
jgi:two-component system NtrC family sensor kinase